MSISRVDEQIGCMQEGSEGHGDTVPFLVGRRGETDPNDVAIADGHRSLTYRELRRSARQLASHLWSVTGKQAQGQVVAILTERSVDFVVGALAVLKLGAAYLPIDPGFPPERIRMILADSGAIALVSHRGLASSLHDAGIPVVDLDTDSLQISGPVDTAALRQASPEDLAYVIYTSGSTGRPKGVEITHASLMNLVNWHCNEFGVTPQDRASQTAGLGFDAAVWEIWPYLCAGATVEIVDDVTRVSAVALRDWLIARKITISFSPTIMAEQLIALDWTKATSLRVLLTGADTLHRRPPAGLPFLLVNNYGPTEYTVVTTSGTVHPSSSNQDRPSIGKPIANTRVWVLDENLKPVAPGSIGELWVSGLGLARGYRNLPEETALRFLPCPVEPSTNAYRTGDRGRMLADGSLEFLGRVDDQVKIRGYRVELAEIATSLSRIEYVEAAVVIAPENANGEKELVAYVVAQPGVNLDRGKLVSHLKQVLPDYMMPGVFVKLEKLPVNSNGKYDRAGLPCPCAANTLADEVPATKTGSGIENTVASALSNLLGVKSIGRDENFFLLGGHSMMAAQLTARMREAFGVKLTLRQLFAAPTIANLAAVIEKLLSEGSPL